jgi:hypothetical protein
MDHEAKEMFALFGLAAMALLFILGMTWMGTRPELNTTTIHKQDRLPVACQEGAQ